MGAEIVPWNPSSFLSDVTAMEEVSKKLANTKHYSKMGADGVFAVLQMAQVVKMDPLWALNDGMYYVQGRVSLSSKALTMMIRHAGHSITKDAKSTKTHVILHGRRKDNGDTCTTSFSVQDARDAGVYKAGGTWDKWSEDMCFARAATRLSKQLFSDVTSGMSVEDHVDAVIQEAESEWVGSAKITPEQAAELDRMINGDDALRSKMLSFYSISSLGEMPIQYYQQAYDTIFAKTSRKSVTSQPSQASPKKEESVSEPSKLEALASGSYADAKEAPSVFDEEV